METGQVKAKGVGGDATARWGVGYAPDGRMRALRWRRPYDIGDDRLLIIIQLFGTCV